MYVGFYTTLLDKELAYYIKNNDLPPIGKDFLFLGFVNTNAFDKILITICNFSLYYLNIFKLYYCRFVCSYMTMKQVV